MNKTSLVETKSTDEAAELKSIVATRQKGSWVTEWDELIENPNKIFEEQGITVKDLERLTYDPHVSSCIQSRKSGVLSLDWEITESKNAEVNTLLDKVFNKLNIRQIIEEMLDAPLFGYVPLEIYWEFEEGSLIPYDIISKPPQWFKYDSLNLLRFMSNDKLDGVVCPPRKFLVVRHRPRYKNPYGDPLLAKCFYPVLFKKGNLKLWTVFTQKYGMPFLAGTPSTSNQASLMADALSKLQADAFTVLPPDAKLEKISAESTSSDVYHSFISFCNAEISKLLLSQTLSTEQGDSGSYALGKAHLEVRESVVESDKTLIENAFNELIRWIVQINISPMPEYPKFVMFKPADVDKNLADRDKVLYDMGLRFTDKYYQVNYGLKQGEFSITEPTTPAAFSDVADSIPEIALDDFSKASAKMLNPVLKMINDGKSFEEIESGILDLFPELATDDIQELIALGINVANTLAIQDRRN